MSGLLMTNCNIKNMTAQPYTSLSWMCVLYNHHVCVCVCMHTHTKQVCINYITSCNRYHKISPFEDTAQCCNSYCRTWNILHNLSLLPPPITSIYNKTDKVFYYILLFFKHIYKVPVQYTCSACCATKNRPEGMGLVGVDV